MESLRKVSIGNLLPGRNSFGRTSSFEGRKNRKKVLLISGVVLLVAISYALSKGGLLNRTATGQANAGEEQVDVKEASASQSIDRSFSFPLTDGAGETVSTIQVTIDKAELRDEIIVQGKKMTSTKGRTFLILNMKVKNDFNKSVEIQTRNYVRLSVNGNEDEWLAPDVHNDPVEVQAISTKLTRLGFPINVTDSNFVLRIGEINGDKERVEIDL